MLPPQFVASAALRRFVPAHSSRWVEAKRQRDFNTADRIRAELEARGIKAEQVRPHVWEPGKRAERDSGGGRGRGGGGLMALPPMPPLGRGRGAPGALGDGGRPKLPPNIDPSVGDWMCPACANWNWARRKECNQCHSAKDGLMRVSGAESGTKRTGEGGGFKEFDQEEDARRKRRATEERLAKEERKKERKKCEYCKRASCIC